MSKPWLEKWSSSPPVTEADWYVGVTGNEDASDKDYERRDLAIAAPAMCRALLVVEWAGPEERYMCPSCENSQEYGHDSSCWLDMALTEAGLPDQESRDAARKELGL